MKCQSRCAADETGTFCLGCSRTIAEIKEAFEKLVDLQAKKAYIKEYKI